MQAEGPQFGHPLSSIFGQLEKRWLKVWRIWINILPSHCLMFCNVVNACSRISISLLWLEKMLNHLRGRPFNTRGVWFFRKKIVCSIVCGKKIICSVMFKKKIGCWQPADLSKSAGNCQRKAKISSLRSGQTSDAQRCYTGTLEWD